MFKARRLTINFDFIMRSICKSNHCFTSMTL